MSKTQTAEQNDYVERQTRAVHNAQVVINQLESDGWEDAEKYVVPLNEITVFVHTGEMDDHERQSFIDRYSGEPYVTELEQDVDGRIWRWSV